MIKKSIFIRLDAGNQFGMGHLSRCLCLAEEFVPDYKIHLCVKTDDSEKVLNFIEHNFRIFSNLSVNFIDVQISVLNEMELIRKMTSDLKAFLIVDHYKADIEYQLDLLRLGIKWLQFDSHGFIYFYANFVLHGSPGATHELYNPLVKNNETKLLIGTKYAIVNKKFRVQRTKTKKRHKVEKIFMCFGGGNDKGAAYKCLNILDSSILNRFEIFLVLSEKNPKIAKINQMSKNNNNLHLVINSSELHQIMSDCDLAIISPGTLSYEAASVGLPMLMVTIADNQNINAYGWERIGAGINVGKIEDLTRERINNLINKLIISPDILKAMSENCYNAVDGKGAERIKDEIASIL